MKESDPTVERLRAVPGLSVAPRRTLAALAPLVDHVEISAGQVLTSEGKSGREAFFVLDGEAEVYIRGEHVATVGPGEFVGEMAMLDQEPRSASVRARTAMHVLVIGPAAFPSLVQDPHVARTIARQLVGRLRRADSPAKPWMAHDTSSETAVARRSL